MFPIFKLSFSFFIISILPLLFLIKANPQNGWDPSKNTYPYARRANTEFTYTSLKNGQVKVKDPYNWLEEDVDKSNETKTFVDAQLALTQSYLNQDKDFDTILKSIGHLNEYVDVDSLQAFGLNENKRYLYIALNYTSSRPIWYIATKVEMFQAFNSNFFHFPGKKWFDENLLSKDGSETIDQFNISPDGKLTAYLVISGGSDQETIYVRNISSPFIEVSSSLENVPGGGTGRFPEVFPFNDHGSVFWIKDSSAFFYTQQIQNETTLGSRIRYHKMGTKYDDDITIVDFPKDPYQYWSLLLSGDMKWIMALLYKGVDYHNAVYVASLDDQQISNNMKWQSIVPDLNSTMYSFGSINSTFYFATNSDGAINYKIVSVQVDKSKAKKVKSLTELTDRLETKLLIPERSDAQMEIIGLDGDVPLFDNDKLVVYYTKEAHQELTLISLTTMKSISKILDDDHGTILSFSAGQNSKEFFLSTTTMNKPKSIYRLWYEENDDQKLNTHKIFDSTVKNVNLDSIISERRFSQSKDGTKIPISIFYKKGAKFDGKSPAMIYFYGQYGYSILPKYTAKFIEWIFGFDGVVFWASPRGGGEEGAKWHMEGQRQYRQNTVDDVISVAEYAVENKIAEFGKIVVTGGSAAGTTCMVVTNQAREGLLGGGLCERGVYDMLRFKILQSNGQGNIPEYGDPQIPSDFDYLIKYSPLENVNKTKLYPTILLQTNANDDNVNPVNTYKMIAELQYDLSKNENPLLMYVGQGAGHKIERNSRKFNVQTDSIEVAIMSKGMGLTRER